MITKFGLGLKGKWLEALRSGKYRQGMAQLESIEDGVSSYCCLGVLCHVAQLESLVYDEPQPKQTASYSYRRDPDHDIDDDPYGLPTTFREDIGMDGKLESKLATMNDRNGKSFSEIADYIEKEWT